MGFSPCAAREHVRVARSLGTLPLLALALARGELSYAKVRALTRVATPETEERLLAVGRAGTTEHVARIVRGWRRVDRQAEARETARQHASRTLYVYPDADGTVILRGRLTPEVGALLVQALAAARETLYQRARGKEREADPPTMVQQQADARAVFEDGLARLIRVREDLGIDVDHDLVALARGAGIEAVVQGRLREQGQRARASTPSATCSMCSTR